MEAATEHPLHDRTTACAPTHWTVRLLWLRIHPCYVDPRAHCWVHRTCISGAAELLSPRALCLPAQLTPSNTLPSGLSVWAASCPHQHATPSVVSLRYGHSDVQISLWLVTTVAGNLFICGLAAGMSSFIKCLLDSAPGGAPRAQGPLRVSMVQMPKKGGFG